MNNVLDIPLSVPNLSWGILENLKEVINTGWISTGGRFIQEFEETFAKYIGTDRAVSLQSGTAGLHLALLASNIGPEDEVIVPTLSFIATVNPVRYVGATPIFMDCDSSLNMDLDKLELFLENECYFESSNLINKRTMRKVKGIIIVHVFGNPINMEKLMNIKGKYKLLIIEDAAEALGSKYILGKYAGKYCGTIGDIGVFSFNANKIITTGGGGMILAQDEDVLNRVRYLAAQGKDDAIFFIHGDIGYNYGMTNISGVIGLEQINRIEEFINIKKENYDYYKKYIDDINGLSILPFNKYARSNYWFYSILVDKDTYGMERNKLLNKLNSNHIQSRPLWRLIHKQKPYLENHSFKIEKAYYYEENIINVPCSTNLNKEQIDRVIEIMT